ncbi:MAG: pitrilysin family protein, partial [Desulfomonilia bacterium]|nr:pitrilysin family protein [Desulfomonilia bacterium]
TPTRSAKQIAREIDAMGGHLNAQTAKEYTVYYTRVLDEQFPKAADILFDLFLNAEISSEELEKEKNVVLQEIRMTEDTPEDYITDLFTAAFFRDTPLGTSILGNVDTVKGLTRERILSFLKERYDPQTIIIASAGNVEHERLVDLAAPLFEGTASHTEREKITPSPPEEVCGFHKAYYRDIEQVHLMLGTKGSEMSDERRWTYIVLNTLLGGSMSSLLFQEAREKLGLVYSIYSYLSAYRDCGVLALYAATTPENVGKTLEVIKAQMIRISQGDLGEVSVDEVKAQIKGNLLLSRESSVNRMSSMAKNEMYYNREVPVEEVIEHIQAVTLDTIVDLARDIFKRDHLTLVTLGRMTQDEMQGLFKDYAQAEAVPAEA